MRPTATRRSMSRRAPRCQWPDAGQCGNAQRLAEAAAAIQRVAVLAVPRGVLGGGQQQAAAVAGSGSCRNPPACRARSPGCADRCRAASRPAPARCTSGAVSWPLVEIGLHPARPPWARRGRCRRLRPRAAICSAPRPPALAGFSMRGGMQIAGQLLVPGGLVEIGGGEIEQLQPLRMLERVPEPAQRVAVLVAMLRQGEVELVVRLDARPRRRRPGWRRGSRAGSCRLSGAP